MRTSNREIKVTFSCTVFLASNYLSAFTDFVKKNTRHLFINWKASIKHFFFFVIFWEFMEMNSEFFWRLFEACFLSGFSAWPRSFRMLFEVAEEKWKVQRLPILPLEILLDEQRDIIIIVNQLIDSVSYNVLMIMN